MEPYDDAVVPRPLFDEPADSLPSAIPETDGDSQSVASDAAGNSCRICRGEGTDEQPLFHPCKCSGSIRYVHQECLIEWLSHSKKKYCELCKTPFRFTKIYDQSMPATLPWPLFVRQLGLHILSTLCRWARYVLVATIWLIALPWCIRQVWRGLFWLADGSWLPETQRRKRAANETMDSQNATSSGTDFGIDDAHSAIVAAFSAFMRFLAGESIAAKIFRVLFSVPPVVLNQGESEQDLRDQRYLLMQRPPSILSDINFIQNWTSPGLTRNLSIDVLEGILICLGLVSGFVLVFLIREWVINQQPVANDADANIARQLEAADEARRQRAIRRHRPRRAARDVNLVAANAGQPMAAPPRAIRRRAMTDDNIGAPATQNPGRPDLPARAQSLVIPPFRPSARNTPGYNDVNTTTDSDVPPPLLRGMVGEVVDARRVLEEGVSTETSQSGSRGAVHSDNHGSTARSRDDVEHMQAVADWAAVLKRRPLTPPPEDSPVLPQGQLSRRSTVTFSDNVSIIARRGSSSDLGGSETPSPPPYAEVPPIMPENDAGSTANDAEPNNGVASPVSDESNPATTEGDADGIQRLQPGRFARLAERVEHFFWFVEDVPDPSLHQDLPGTEPPAEPAEAPFVPGQNRGFGLLPEEAHQPPPVPVEPIDAGQAFDLNDPNALEDAEDLEGVMELVGMEGPLIGMVQNVVFSLLLISLTLAAAVWIPYIWGKIALILLANPVAVVFKAPLYVVTSCVDLVADICFFVLGLLGLLFNIFTKTVKATTEPIMPSYAKLLDTETFEQLAVNVTHQSGSRLEKTLREAIIIFSPDLPTFSMQSHRALISFKTSMSSAASLVSNFSQTAYESFHSTQWSISGTVNTVTTLFLKTHHVPRVAAELVKDATGMLRAAFKPELQPMTLDTSSPRDLALVEWSTQDKIMAIVLGYIFFAISGLLFMKAAHVFLGLKKNEKVEGAFADRLREAGGVLKVIVIIGIEMIVFPLYCGLLFDFAMLPLFEGATVGSRLAFILKAPFTGLFLHWFAGTCYMFHFALFVSMCRKILRKGVLYFIRDPDDPTFHPVRDVLERPVPTQLGKIAFSALVYGGLVIVCLGGVVWSVASIGDVLPIRWATPEPRLAFPLDVVFFNLAIPFLVRKAKPSEKVAALYEWWFRGTAHGLRLTHFLFNENREDEKRPAVVRVLSWDRKANKIVGDSVQDGIYVRAPASDSCRIPKNHKTFLQVTADNKRIDGSHDDRHGLHGRKNANFAFFWLPPHFRARIATFVVLLWLFAAGTGIACTIGPLVIGRKIIQIMSGTDAHVNDLYALTLGAHILAALTYLGAHAGAVSRSIVGRVKATAARPVQAMPHVFGAIKYVAGLVYLGLTFGIVLPFALSFITELYIHVPIFAYIIDTKAFITAAPNSSSAVTTFTHSAAIGVANNTMPPIPPTVFILQTWTLGLLYLRLALRVAVTYPCHHTRLSTAIQLITRKGFWRPNVWLATRAVVIPLGMLCTVALTVPGVIAWSFVASGLRDVPEDPHVYYRLAYPATAGVLSGLYWLWQARIRLAAWRSVVRDEVYLVGERLHNYATEGKEKHDEKGKGTAGELTAAALPNNVRGEAPIALEGPALTENGLINEW